MGKVEFAPEGLIPNAQYRSSCSFSIAAAGSPGTAPGSVVVFAVVDGAAGAEAAAAAEVSGLSMNTGSALSAAAAIVIAEEDVRGDETSFGVPLPALEVGVMEGVVAVVGPR